MSPSLVLKNKPSVEAGGKESIGNMFLQNVD
jgi:hypothetical protein